MTEILNWESSIKKWETNVLSERKLSKVSSTYNSSTINQCMNIKPAKPQGADRAALKKKKLDRSKFLTKNLEKSTKEQSMLNLELKRRHS